MMQKIKRRLGKKTQTRIDNNITPCILTSDVAETITLFWITPHGVTKVSPFEDTWAEISQFPQFQK